MANEIQREWFTLPEAHQYSGVSVRELRRLISAERLPASKLNPSQQGHVRVRRSDLNALLEGSPVR
ncbi:helix-turn-helix domain-containing protein [Paractinoplanes durhamensis]|uniref:Helix-turn-helix domain-containing protein n=1 Tax=Paractinoplanes durhamensis TaxID=113563 RepID=A0ABQ3ZBS3_9ACTN|nr:helix-turn-helix domain-containing protein [Actinoplanes durhamensis]GIE07284.1 hypothetical protein Adu01nite_86340 [Actinoplanes durhamensis]